MKFMPNLMTRSSTAAEGMEPDVVFAAFPTDPASVFVYILVVVACYMIWKASRKARPPL